MIIIGEKLNGAIPIVKAAIAERNSERRYVLDLLWF